MRDDETALTSSPQKSKRPWIILSLILVAAIAVGIFCWWYFAVRSPYKTNLEPNAVIGIMPGKSKEELEAELTRRVDEKTIAFVINAEPVFENGSAKGNIMFENPEANNKLTRMELYLDDGNELIAETGLLMPGSYVPEIKLSKKLKKGDYKCTAYIYAYKLDSEDYIGKVAAGVTVHIAE